MWDLQSVLDACVAALRDRANRLDEEQAQRGIDWLDEVGLHPIVRQGLADAGFGVHPEQRYPSGAINRRRNEGERCDLVLTPKPGRPLTDPLLAGTLFASAGTPLADALWIEIKSVGQFHAVEGAPRPNTAYASGLTSAVFSDARKLAREDAIVAAAILLIAFVQSEAVADNDLAVWRERAIRRSVPVSTPLRGGFAITDRIGNAWCAVGLARVHHL